MMILTQDGKTIASTDNLNYIQVEEVEKYYRDYEYAITAFYGQDRKPLGKYKTAERANEILQNMYDELMLQNFTFTYKMPKE